MAKSKHQPKAKSAHVLIACGGTGGHLFPGIAVAETLKERGYQSTLLISEKKIDDLASSGHSDLHFEKMPFLAMPKPWSPKMIAFLSGVFKGFQQCKGIIQKNDTKVVLGMGGFTSFAPALAGQRTKLPTMIHDSNAIPGKANRIIAKFCNTVLLGFEECGKYFPAEKEKRVVGTPIRSALSRAAKSQLEDPYKFFNLDPKLKTVVIIGGSQGARGINNAIVHSLRHLVGLGIQLLHITGPGDYKSVRDSYQGKEMGETSHVAAFCHRMELAYAIADLVLARSGASTLAELAYFGVPSILVPYPHAADDHQTLNAEIFHKAGAGLMIREGELSPEKLVESLQSILLHKDRYDAMKKATESIGVKDAAERIADLIEEKISAA